MKLFFSKKSKKAKKAEIEALETIEEVLQDESTIDFTDTTISDEQIKHYSQYSIDLAKKLDINIGRIAGSKGEKKYASALRENCECDLEAPTKLEPFASYIMRGRLSFIPMAAWFLVSLVFYLLSFAPKGLGGIVFTAIVTVFSLLGFGLFYSLVIGKNTFKKLSPKKTSYNMVSKVEARDKAKRRVVLFANYDSKHGPWFKGFDEVMPVSLLTSGVAILLFFLFCILKMALGFSMEEDTAIKPILSVLPIVTSGFAIVLLSLSVSVFRKDVQENNGLSMTTAVAVAKFLKENNRIENDVEILVVGLGAENCGREGAENFIKKHKNEEWMKDALFINISDVVSNHLTVIEKDPLRKVEFDKALVEKAVESAKEKDMTLQTYDQKTNTFYGYSSTIFKKAGLNVLNFMSKDMDFNSLKDGIEKSDINNKTIERIFNFLSTYIIKSLTDENSKFANEENKIACDVDGDETIEQKIEVENIETEDNELELKENQSIENSEKESNE